MKASRLLIVLTVCCPFLLGLTGCKQAENPAPPTPVEEFEAVEFPEAEAEATAAIVIERLDTGLDKDNDGIGDLEDIVRGARLQVELKPRYVADYFQGGYPPDDIAVCTDIVWRALRNAGYELKPLVDKDIGENTDKYPRVNGKPDPHIDFRRVQNLTVFFSRHATVLTKELKPWDETNLTEWQGGDLVTFRWGGIDHIAVVSDRRRPDGVPYLIHTYGSYPVEDDTLLGWSDTITGHFRFPKAEDI